MPVFWGLSKNRKPFVISPLLTDLYQLTMAYGYWKLGIQDREAVFHIIFRKFPFKGNYVVACGLDTIIEFLQNWHFTADDLAYLKQLKAPDDTPLFSDDFLDYLKNLKFTCDIDAIPEGTVVFPHEPLLRVKGPLLQGQLLESTLMKGLMVLYPPVAHHTSVVVMPLLMYWLENSLIFLYVERMRIVGLLHLGMKWKRSRRMPMSCRVIAFYWWILMTRFKV
jgi:nicotinic acid phosphoribosyltransferase